MVEEFLLSRHRANIIPILQDKDAKKHFAVDLSFIELFENDTNLGNDILKNADEALQELDCCILDAQNYLVEQSEDETLTIKSSVHARVYGLPICPELHRSIFPRNEDVDLFLQVTGTVVRVTATKMLEYQRPYKCLKCKHVQVVEAVYEQKYVITPPRKCLNPENCPGTNMASAGGLNADNCKDYQEVKIQEQSSKLGVGTMPGAMWVTLEDDLVDACKPGDDVTICGIVKRRWGPLIVGKLIDVELALKANHIQVNNDQTSPSLITPEIRSQFVSFWEKYKNCPLDGRDVILKSFCPKLYGMYIVKLAMAVVLAGGSRCTQGNEMGIQIRSEPHILLVGDPGTGKSQLLRYAAKVIPRSVLTTGVGTTSAGLTVAAVMEDGQWQLEGGALVLADGGICCIDEFNSMKPHDRTSIHEAMEQQTISVAKASMVCKLKTRCSILAATNPKGGHLDPSQPLSLNLSLPSPLLSRFDIVLMLKDCYDKNWDNLVADYILSGKGISAIEVGTNLWNLETLQQYFTIIRSLNPVLTSAANKILGSYYQAQRRGEYRNKARTTVRLLDSLVRLSQAHARLMFHTEVHVMDALFAVFLIENSMHGECAVLSSDTVNVIAPFLAQPMENYAKLATSVLQQLGLRDILKNEAVFLNSGYEYNRELYVNQEHNALELGSFATIDVSDEPSVTTLNDTTKNATNEEPEESFGVVVQNQIEEENSLNSESRTISKGTGKSDFYKRFKFKKRLKDEQADETKVNINENEASASKINGSSETKKRKNSKSPKDSNTSKSMKKTDHLNDFQMLNLIRSANDEFDPNVLNFMGDDADQSESMDVNESVEVLPNNSSVDNEDNFGKSINHQICVSKNEKSPPPVVAGSSKFLQAVENFSQNTVLKCMRANFSFKPRTPANLPKNTENRKGELDISDSNNIKVVENSDEHNQLQNQSQNLFQSPDFDDSCLDF